MRALVITPAGAQRFMRGRAEIWIHTIKAFGVLLIKQNPLTNLLNGAANLVGPARSDPLSACRVLGDCLMLRKRILKLMTAASALWLFALLAGCSSPLSTSENEIAHWTTRLTEEL